VNTRWFVDLEKPTLLKPTHRSSGQAGAAPEETSDRNRHFAWSIVCVFVLLICAGAPALAQRQAVLPQIDLPHPYYYRELYLPQLTSGPSSVAWSPDSSEVVYSMAGSLWRQRIDSPTAQQLTDGPGYDYQPDWSPDGKGVVYVSYQKDAMELRLLELDSGKSRQLTEGGAVNVEPRFSPDGRRLVFVSTSYNKRFHVFRADLHDGRLENVVRLTGETKSPLLRYYYSAFDTEINPVWTRDGREILFVSNRGHIHGTGGFWRMRAEPGAEAHEIHYEETNWKARPDFSPDGSRMVYSSYLGRQWHQLWVMPAGGGDVFPISYGDWDQSGARWSPDGEKIAFVSNETGNTSLWYQKIPGGDRLRIRAEKRTYIRPRATMAVGVGGTGAAAVRMSVVGDDGMFYAPDEVWISADDGFDRHERAFEAHYFHVRGQASLSVPAGKYTIEVMRGFEVAPEKKVVEIRGAEKAKVELAEPTRMFEREMHGDKEEWVGADLHVHMNYGGNYRNTPGHLAEQAEAEDVGVVNDLIVNKEQRFPDIAYQGGSYDAAQRGLAPEGVSYRVPIVVHGQEFHTSYWGHRGLLNIRDHVLLPGYAGYPNTAASSLVPMNVDVYDLGHAWKAMVGAVHPFDEAPDPFASPAQKITDELPVDAALGKLDYMEVVGFSDHRATASVWYRLLNLGFRIPAGAGTDATANYAAPIRGHVGMDRAYARVPAGLHGEALGEAWYAALRAGRTFATNGPLLSFRLGDAGVGDELKFDGAQASVGFSASMASVAPVDHLEIVCNGRVVKSLDLPGARDRAAVTGAIPVKESGWCVLRAWSEKAVWPVMDKYAYATTSPIYVKVAGQKARSPEDAKYFAAWIARTIEVTEKYPDWNSAAEKERVLSRLNEANGVYERMQ
jgi:TolB protein